MADLDEAAINNPSTGGGGADIDLSDETQDFRMLSNLSFLTDSTDASLPKRGEKDFEPNPTLYQADILSASRQAMHNALAYPRLHHPKNRLLGVYAPNGPAPPASQKTLDTVAETPSTEKPAPASIGAQVSPDACVYVANPKGQFFKSLGHADRWGRVWLLPEEALYLLERGSLDMRWPRCSVGDGDENDIEDSGIPMSLQAAYACLIGRGGLTMERFSVFTGLRRLGYAVIRAPGWHGHEVAPATEPPKPKGPGLIGVFSNFLKWLCHPAPTTTMGPVAGLGFHRSYKQPYIVVWHVYKPSTAFKKSAPPKPDFKIAVINARTDTNVPRLSQIGPLLESTPLDPPNPDRQLYVRLRNGYRNVILAVVDQGVQRYSQIFSRTTPLRFSRTQRPLRASENLPARTERGIATFHPSNRLSGRTCMITGGSSGIGFSIAERFLNEGIDRIILVGRSYERLLRAAKQLEPATFQSHAIADATDSDNGIATKAPEGYQQTGGDIPPTQGTVVEISKRVNLLVGDISTASTWTKQLETAMTPVSILINAAGISTSTVLPRTDPDDISQVLRTNLEGSLLTSRALVRASIRSRMGSKNRGTDDVPPPPQSKCIINIASLLALKGGTGAVPYAASKAGVLGLTRSLTVEVSKSLRGQVIRCNAIVPGYIETPMIADFSEGENAKLKEEIPLRRFGQPHEIADAAVFLAQNEYANNCVINLDGGLSAL
ncbi:uncharacterized protein BDV14DRAFT_192067 [Aspergillus stella-maris]|uniref:uncharacterized protein n=1 Tax=Aspergillus stella-maris TaxID=1810926 RepID=UPI003CCD3B37